MITRLSTRNRHVGDLIPLMVTIARESRRLSQSALAAACGISQAAISQIESGRLVPSESVLQRIADHLGYPLSLFAVAVPFRQLPVTFFRKKSRVAIRDVAAIRARVNLYRLRLEVLLRSDDLHDPRIALADILKDGVTPASAAQRLRTYWNVAPGPIVDLTALLEKFGILIVPMDFGSDAVSGLSLFEPNDSLPPMIFVNRSMPADRWRMTVAHELGHIVLHHHLHLPPAEKQMEDEAFAFAQEFLVPAREISPYLGNLTMRQLAHLKKHWRVSMRALVMRADAMGRLTERQARWLWVQLAREGPRESVEIAEETAKALSNLVDLHVTKLGYSHRDLSDALHQNVDEFRSDFGLVASHLRLA